MDRNKEIAETIIAQMGGFGKLRLMVGAKDFVYGDRFVQFSFKGSRKVNKCKVALRWDDTYDFQLWRIRGADFEKVYECEGAYWDMLIDLFERNTGLYLTL